MSDPVTEIEDPALDPFRDIRDRDLRGRTGGFVVESPRVAMRFLDAVGEGRYDVEGVAIVPELAPTLVDRLVEERRSFVTCTEAVLTAASGYRFHAGVLAIGRRPPRRPDLPALWRAFEKTEPRAIVMLAGVTSMDNIGGIFRSVAALGGDAVILDGRCGDPLLRRCLRISMGQVFRVPWVEVERLSGAIDGLRSRGFAVHAIENTADAADIDAGPFGPRVALMIGNEGHGIPDELLSACDDVRRIPGPDDLPAVERPGGSDERSLNAGVACSIALHEALRSRRR